LAIAFVIFIDVPTDNTCVGGIPDDPPENAWANAQNEHLKSELPGDLSMILR